MGLTTLPSVARGLVAAGRNPATPAAIIDGSGSGAMRRLDPTLTSLPWVARGWSEWPPALVLVGEVVRLAAGAGGDPLPVRDAARDRAAAA